MPKRSNEEKLEYYRKKLRKYEQTSLNIEGNQPVQEGYSPTGYTPMYYDVDHEVVIEAVEPVVETAEPVFETAVPDSDSDGSEDSSAHGPIPLEAKPAEPEEPPSVVLDAKILKALGEITDTSPKFGEPIHNNLVQLWSPLLKQGLSKDHKEALFKEHRIPENCKLLQSPKLNAEIMAAISDLARNRDKKMSNTQEQLGVGISVISRALSLLLSDQSDKIKIIKYLSDGCRLLCDLHFYETSCRMKLVTPNLDPSFCKLMQDVERDETLFGEKLSEKIKASKAISRQGNQIKKPVKPMPQLTAGRPNNTQGNWSGPPRSSNRGGRGGIRRPYNNAANNSRGAPPPPQQQQSQPGTNKPRGQPTQQRR